MSSHFRITPGGPLAPRAKLPAWLARGMARAVTGMLALLAGGLAAQPAMAACTVTTAPNYNCTGALASTTIPATANVAVGTTAPFSISGTGTNGLFISGTGTISYTDTAASPITDTTGSRALYVAGTGDIASGNAGSVTISTNGALNGGGYGLNATNAGTGLLSVKTTGTVQSSTTSGRGIAVAATSAGNAGVTVNAAAGVSGGYRGIEATNSSGNTNVSATGPVTASGGSGMGAGIYVTAAGDIAVNTASVTSNLAISDGIYASTTGSGGITAVHAAGDVSATRYGVFVQQNTGSGNVGVLADAAVATSGSSGVNSYGIYVTNSGNGSANVQANGAVTANTGLGVAGIRVDNLVATNQALTVTTGAGAVQGGTHGIQVTNNGNNGPTNVTTAAGAVSGSTGFGIWESNTAGSGPVTITTGAGAVTGSGSTSHGIGVQNNGNSSATVTTGTGTVSGVGTGSAGIRVQNGTNSGTGTPVGTDLTVTAGGPVQGVINGIWAINYGSGQTTVTSTGAVSAQAAAGVQTAGINAQNLNNSTTDLTVNVQGGSVVQSATPPATTGGTAGIFANNTGTGVTAVNLSGNSQVQGDVNGINVKNSANATSGVTVNIADSASVGSVTADAVLVVNNANTSSSSTTVTQTGTGIILSNGGGFGINVTNNGQAKDLTVTANAVLANTGGISTTNNGAGVTSIAITNPGAVTGNNQFGISAANATQSAGVSVSVPAGTSVTGLNRGISVTNSSSSGDSSADATNINVAGSVVASALTGTATISGVYVQNNPGSDGALTVTVPGTVLGLVRGINTINSGSGNTAIDVTGTVTGTNQYGIYALHDGTSSGNLGVSVPLGGTVNSAARGIDALNCGTGATQVDLAGKVASSGTPPNNNTLGYGIYAWNAVPLNTATIAGCAPTSTPTGDLTVTLESTAQITGLGANSYAVYAQNDGTGATLVTANLPIANLAPAAPHGYGIEAVNTSANAGALTVTTLDVAGDFDGIIASNAGKGDTNVSVTGAVSGTTDNGASATQLATATGNLTVDITGKASGVTAGVAAFNLGGGKTVVDVGGAVSASGRSATAAGVTTNTGSGIVAINGVVPVTTPSGSSVTSVMGLSPITASKGTELDVDAGSSVSGYVNGIFAVNAGAGPTNVTVAGDVSATLYNGIMVAAGPATVDPTTGAAMLTGLGASTGVVVAPSGNVTGGNNAISVGIATQNGGTGATTITTASGKTVQGNGAAITASVYSSGSTPTTWSASQPINVTLNGITQNASGLPSALAVQTAVGAATVTNNSTLTGVVQLDNTQTGNADAMVNNNIWNTAGGTNWVDGTVTNSANATINAVVLPAPTPLPAPVSTTFDGLGTALDKGLTNQGTIALQNGVVRDKTYVNGSYTGSGSNTVSLDTTLGNDSSPSDVLYINGGIISGSTTLDIQNVGGTGALTNVGIKVVDTTNSTGTGTFVLKGSYMVAGEYLYTLEQKTDGWYLVSVPFDGPAGEAIRGLNRVPATTWPGLLGLIGLLLAVGGARAMRRG